MGITPCAQCAGTICLGSSPNFECEYGGDWCQTRTMGMGEILPDCGGGGNITTQTNWTLERERIKQTNAVFVNFCCVRSIPRLEKAGIYVGCVITHINRVHYADVKEFGARLHEIAVNDEKDIEIGFLRFDVKANAMQQHFVKV